MNQTDKKIISVVIRARNAARDLEKCLWHLKKQLLPPNHTLELIIVDNDSTDDTVFVALSYNASIVTIGKDQFTWGKALNIGIEKTNGYIVLLLSADACPVNQLWLTEMIKPFADPAVVVVYGRQIPRKDAGLDERVRLAEKFGKKSEKFDFSNSNITKSARGMIISNACAAIRKSMWDQIKYDENIEGGEEGPWTWQALKAGNAYVYQASAMVLHSHNDHVFRFAWREMEILQKNLRLKGCRMDIAQLFRLIGSFGKRRLRNCGKSGLPVRVKVAAIMRMPIEMFSFCLAFALSNTRYKQKFRDLMWK